MKREALIRYVAEYPFPRDDVSCARFSTVRLSWDMEEGV